MKTNEIYEKIKGEISKAIVGQRDVIEELVVGLFSRGHVLLEGVPGTAKTLIAKVLAHLLSCEFKRIQFTPDLMPSDIVGTSVFDMKSGAFYVKKGPIFTNLLLADEINRTPPKTQAALLEAMEERQVTIEGVAYPLDEPFMVCATQNPIEYEGTYPLPEAQCDRFMLKIRIDYPGQEEGMKILDMYHGGFDPHQLESRGVEAIIDRKTLQECREEIRQVTVEKGVMEYINTIVTNTRKNDDIVLGASPRAAVMLLLTGKTLAAMKGKDYLTPDEIKRLSLPVLRHRLILKPEAEIEGLTPELVISNILDSIEVPR